MMNCPHCGKEIEDPRAEHARRIGKLGGRPAFAARIQGKTYTRVKPIQRRMVKGTFYYLCESGDEMRWLDRHGNEIHFNSPAKSR